MQYKDVNPTASHKSTPCSIGRHPTSLSVVREMPLPIKKSVAVNPRRPTVKSCALACVTKRTYVFSTAAKIKNNMNQGKEIRER